MADKGSSTLAASDEFETKDEAKKALHWAAYWGEDDQVAKLLDAGEDVNRYAALPIVLPGFSSLPSITKIFTLHLGGRRKTHTALHVACIRGHASVVRLLLARGANASLATREVPAETAIDIAKRQKFTEVLGLLGAGRAGPEASNASASPGKAEDCIVCMERESSTVFLNCGHMACCVECATSLTAPASPLCPVCRAPIERFIRVFKAGV